ncbi:hypothetical protein [Angustibacter luteus]|uniref:Uncharacterized protein n=1 Tax=Angustibacter luteus TaxID=658456 RepID=A0ABW1JGU9_9ACTN
MRWDRLFDDLQAQLAAADAAEVAGELTERTRLELSRLTLADRLLAWVGQPLAVHPRVGPTLSGELRDVGPDWLLVGGVAVTLVPARAVTSLSGLGVGAVPAGHGLAARRYGLSAVLRAVARDRSPVRVLLTDGAVLTGTVDAVGADHLDLAEHAPDLARRRQAVRAVRVVPFAALVTVQPAPGTTSLG